MPMSRTAEASATAVDRVAAAVRGDILSAVLAPGEPHFTLDTLIEEHRALLDELPTRGGDAVRAHLEHSTRLLIDA